MARMNWDRVNRERNLPDYSERMDAAEARLRERAIERARTRAASNSRTGEPAKTAAAHPARKARPAGAKKSGNSSPIAKSTPKGKPQKVKATRKKARRKGALGLVQVREQVVNPSGVAPWPKRGSDPPLNLLAPTRRTETRRRSSGPRQRSRSQRSPRPLAMRLRQQEPGSPSNSSVPNVEQRRRKQSVSPQRRVPWESPRRSFVAGGAGRPTHRTGTRSECRDGMDDQPVPPA